MDTVLSWLLEAHGLCVYCGLMVPVDAWLLCPLYEENSCLAVVLG